MARSLSACEALILEHAINPSAKDTSHNLLHATVSVMTILITTNAVHLISCKDIIVLGELE